MNILLSIAIAWIVCQAIKIIHSKKLSAFWNVGGMPSAHSSLAGALSTAVALQDGYASTTAAIAYVLLAIVIHDALHIRKHHDLKEISVGLAVGIIIAAILHYM